MIIKTKAGDNCPDYQVVNYVEFFLGWPLFDKLREANQLVKDRGFNSIDIKGDAEFLLIDEDDGDIDDVPTVDCVFVVTGQNFFTVEAWLKHDSVLCCSYAIPFKQVQDAWDAGDDTRISEPADWS